MKNEKRGQTPFTLLAIAAASMIASASANAANWSDDSVGLRYVSDQSEPGVSHKVAKNVMNFTHVSGDNLGTNFFTIDLLKSNSADPSNAGPGGAQEWYGFYKRTFSLSALTGNNADSLTFPLQGAILSAGRQVMKFPATYTTAWNSQSRRVVGTHRISTNRFPHIC